MTSDPGRCPKCGSSKTILDVQVVTDTEHHAGEAAAVHRRPRAFFLKGGATTPVRAVVCARCGFAEFYASEPADLVSVYLESRPPAGS